LSRVMGDGMGLLFQIKSFSFLLLVLVTIIALWMPHPVVKVKQAKIPKITISMRIYPVAAGLMLGIGVSFIYNLNLWSSKTPDLSSAIYLYSFAIGIFLALLLSRYLLHERKGMITLFGISALSLTSSFVLLFYFNLPYLGNFAAHTVGSFGLAILGFIFLRRLFYFHKQYTVPVSLISLEIGFMLFLLLLNIFYFIPNPVIFWAMLALIFGSMIVNELKHPIRELISFPLRHLKNLFGLFAVLLVAGAFYVKLPTYQPFEAASEQLRIMTSNIRYGWSNDYRFEPKVHLEFLKQQSADIIGFQEVNKGHGYGGYNDNYQFYKSGLNGFWVYGDANFGFGNALRSRYPIKSFKTRKYSLATQVRGVLIRALIDYNGTDIEVFTTHLSGLRDPSVREDQADELIAYLKETEFPWILIGDLNLKPSEPKMQEFLALADPVFRQNKALLEGHTYPSDTPEKRIDYVLFSPEFDLIEQKILDNQGSSDHRPILAVLELKKGSVK